MLSSKSLNAPDELQCEQKKDWDHLRQCEDKKIWAPFLSAHFKFDLKRTICENTLKFRITLGLIKEMLYVENQDSFWEFHVSYPSIPMLFLLYQPCS